MISQAFITKYIPATNNKSARIKVQCARGKIFLYYNDQFDIEQNHILAVKELISRFVDEDERKYKTPPENNPWRTHFITGNLPDGSYCHVFCK